MEQDGHSKHVTTLKDSEELLQMGADLNGNQLTSSDDEDHHNDLFKSMGTPSPEKMQSNPYHVKFKSSPSRQSVADLLRDSSSLLLPEGGLRNNLSYTVFRNNSEKDVDQPKTATILQLCWEDRKRIGELISELASANDLNQELASNLEKAERRERKCRDKVSILMKKVDVLGEKSERFDNDKRRIKDQHLESLTALQSKITLISSKFETSVDKITALTSENERIKSENNVLKEKAAALKCTVKTGERERQKTSELLKVSMQNEISLEAEVKNLTEKLEEIKSTFSFSNLNLKHGAESIASNSWGQNGSVPTLFARRSWSNELCHPTSQGDFSTKQSLPVPTASEKTITSTAMSQSEDAVLQDLFFKF